MLRAARINDILQIEREFVSVISNTTFYKQSVREQQQKLERVKGKTQVLATLQEFINDDYMIVQKLMGPTLYTRALSIVDQDLLEPGCTVYLNEDNHMDLIVGIQMDDTDPAVNAMKIETKPKDSYADVGGLDDQIQEIREIVELPLTQPERYEELGVTPPKACILYGPPGSGKSLLARAVAHETSSTFLRMAGSEMIQSYSGEGPRLVRELFKAAREMAPSIVFIDEIDAVGTKRVESDSGGGREIQRTLLELLNQMDGFDQSENVKVIMATNRIQALDSALIRPGRVDRKIYVPLPNPEQRRHIFAIHTKRMTLDDDVQIDEIVNSKADMSGADIKAICLEAGLLALRERRMRVIMEDFRQARDKVLFRKQEQIPDLYT